MLGCVRRLSKPSPTQGIRYSSQTVFDPHRLEDENGNPVVIATTSRGISFRDVSTAVPAFWQRGKRKSMERDEQDTENDLTASVSPICVHLYGSSRREQQPHKRPKLGSDDVFVDYLTTYDNIGDQADVRDASNQPRPLEDVENKPSASIPNTGVSVGCDDAASCPIM